MRNLYLKSLIYLLPLLLINYLGFSQVLINEVYGGGNNSGAPFRNDFIELYNNSSSPVAIGGWKVEYFSSGGNSGGSVVFASDATIQAGAYFLVQLGGGTTNGVPLPAPDATGSVNMSATNGRVDLINSTSTLLDRVGFGTANLFEGTGAAPTLSNTTSAQRTPTGTDTDNNNADFTKGSPSPTNSAEVATNTVSVFAGNNAAEPSTNGSFSITLSSPAPAGGITVSYTLGGSSTLNEDYSDPQNGTITIAQGSGTATIALTVMDDAIIEGTETIDINLNTASNGYTIATSSASINLSDNEFSPISLTGTYLQDFNTLAISGTSSSLPLGWLFLESGANTNTLYTTGTGSGTGGDTYSFGASSGTDRAFGGLQSGSLIPSIGASFTNNSGSPVTALQISYTGEQWRLGSAGRTDRLDFQFSLDATDLSTGNWTNVAELGFTTPNTGTTGAKDGNDAANRRQIEHTISGLSIPAGTNFFIRWNDVNASGADDGLAIDDFTIEANPADNAVPVIAAIFPAHAATNVSINSTASITFNETVLKGTGNIIVKRTNDNSVFRTIDVTSTAVSVSATTVSFSMSGLEANTGYYIEIDNGAFDDLSGNDFAGISGNSVWAFTTGTLFYTANFNTCSSSLPDGFMQYSVTGAQVWSCTPFGKDAAGDPKSSAPKGVQINGFSGTNIPNEDWLISPAFDLTSATYPLLSFWSRTAFNGAPLQLKVSMDYTGGDPALANWRDINGKFPGQTSDAWTLSSGINLSEFKGSTVHFAFVYTSSEDDGARWTLDDIQLDNSATPPPPTLTAGLTDIQFTYVTSGSSSDKTFTFIGNDLTEDVTLTSSGAFLLSKDGNSYSSMLTYTATEANNVSMKVHVRFTPTQNNQDFNGVVTVATSGLTATISLKGTSIDPATTLEVVNWNIEWFGSSANGPRNDEQQAENVKNILLNIGADVYGLTEIVSEVRLASVVSGMPGYAYVISDYGSHTNTSANPASALTEAQKLAFIYKTGFLSNVSATALLSAGINSPADITNPAYNYWASGRFPYMLTADVTLNCVTKNVKFVLVHGKANTSPTTTSYNRRKSGSDTLYQVLNELYPNDNIIILGDFNDDLDQSITAGFTTTSWDAFTTDTDNYSALTLPLSLAGKKSTVSYNDVIDHVVVSNEINDYYLSSTASILTDVTGLVSNYASSTSDHYPVFTRYMFEAPAAPVITSCTISTTLCESINEFYTIPVFTAAVSCGELSYSYEISGTTERSGTSNNASGNFEIGTSIITWTVTDAFGNSSTCQTTIVINPNPSVTIPDVYALSSGVQANTVYIGYTPASSVTLVPSVSSGTRSYSYNWSDGSTQASINVSPLQSTTYKVVVTDANGCSDSTAKTIKVMDLRAGKKMDKVKICHKQGFWPKTFEVSGNDVQNHLAHGDQLGSCQTSNLFDPKNPKLSDLLNIRFDIVALPNPSNSYFIINIKGISGVGRISFKVTDLLGRVIERKENLSSSPSLQIGSNYQPGLYILEVIAGDEKFIIKLIKRN